MAVIGDMDLRIIGGVLQMRSALAHGEKRDTRIKKTQVYTLDS